jgi:hypothetical protein
MVSQPKESIKDYSITLDSAWSFPISSVKSFMATDSKELLVFLQILSATPSVPRRYLKKAR